MKEHPIIFSGPLVKAILDNKKSQTRRVIKPQPGGLIEDVYHRPDGNWISLHLLPKGAGVGIGLPFKCPYGKPGDLLYVKETWSDHHCFDGQILYKATDERKPERWHPSIYMPRKASRIILEITDVRVERVQEISEEDARAEGIMDGGCLNCGEHEPCGCNDPQPDARDAFIYLWNSINEKRGYGWDMNPWCWCISFKKIDK